MRFRAAFCCVLLLCFRLRYVTLVCIALRYDPLRLKWEGLRFSMLCCALFCCAVLCCCTVLCYVELLYPRDRSLTLRYVCRGIHVAHYTTITILK